MPSITRGKVLVAALSLAALLGSAVFAGILYWAPPAVQRSTDDRITISLAVEVERGDRNDTPVFDITIRNDSDEPLTVIDTRTDPALQGMFAPVVLTSLDWWRDVGPEEYWVDVLLEPNQMVPLAPGESLTYVSRMEFARYLVYSDIAPGTYRAQLRYQPDPRNAELVYWSPPVEFTLEQAMRLGPT